MKYQSLPNDHTVMRFVPATRTIRDENTDEILGIFGEAFRRKEDEEYLSVTWVEFYDGCYWEQLVFAFAAIRKVQTVGKKAAIAWARVGSVHEACRRQNIRVRIVHEADSEENLGHSGIRQLPRDDDILLDMLASDAFAEYCAVKNIPPP